MKNNNKIEAANIYFDDVSFLGAAERIRVLSRKPTFTYVVTPNVDHMQRLSSLSANSELHTIYQRAALSLCDSRILDKLLRLKGKRVQEIVPGSSLTQHLFDHVLVETDKVLIIGVEDRYIAKLRLMYPLLDIQHINPSMGFINKPEEVESLLEQIKTINPNFVFVSVGSPRQEVLVARIAQMNVIGGVGLCMGASILFVVGAEKRAPVIFQKLHLEWLYRIIQNPRRLGVRYFKNLISLPAIMKSL